MTWQDIPGWFRWRDLQVEAVEHFPQGSRFVEVGVYLGRSLCSLGQLITESGKAISVIGVDTCLGSGPEGPDRRNYHAEALAAGGGTFAGIVHRNVIACGGGEVTSLVVGSSVEVAAWFPDRAFAWIHLDARHEYEDVKRDIDAWRPKVAPGGWLSGDDFDPVKWPGVVAAVRELLPEATPCSDTQWRWRADA